MTGWIALIVALLALAAAVLNTVALLATLLSHEHDVER